MGTLEAYTPSCSIASDREADHAELAPRFQLTGDEVLEYREAFERYAGAERWVVPGGDRTIASFADHISHMLKFSGLAADSPELRA